MLPAACRSRRFARTYGITNNKTHEFADWDWDALANELAALRESDFDLELTGFDRREIAEMEGDDPIGGLTNTNDAPSFNDSSPLCTARRRLGNGRQPQIVVRRLRKC